MRSVDEAVRVVGPDAGGLAELVAAILRGNLRRHPARLAALGGPAGVVRVTATDSGQSVTLELRGGEARIYPGATAGPPDVELTGPSGLLLTAVAAPRIGPLPNPLTAGGRRVLAAAVRGEVTVRGGTRGRRILGRVRRLLTTDPR